MYIFSDSCIVFVVDPKISLNWLKNVSKVIWKFGGYVSFRCI